MSYSHEDRAFVERLQASLQAMGKDVWVDQTSIRSGSRWEEDLRDAIEDADTFVFVISPDSAASEECLRELYYTLGLNKRLIPVNYRRTPLDQLAEPVRAVQFVPPRGLFEGEMGQPLDPSVPESLRAEEAFRNSVALLAEAIATDLEALREHTTWGKKALEWERHARDKSFLVTGSALSSAEKWLGGATKGPAPTDLQRAFVLASRERSSRRQRTLLGAVSFALVIALMLGLLALVQRDHAVSESKIAERNSRLAVLEANQALSSGLAFESADVLPNDIRTGALLSLGSLIFGRTEAARQAVTSVMSDPLDAIIQNSGEDVQSVAYTANGEMLAGIEDSGIDLWDASTGKKLPDIPSSTAIDISLSPNGTLAELDASTDVIVWNISTRRQIAEMPSTGSDNTSVQSIAFSPDGRRLALALGDGNVVLLDATTDKRVALLAGCRSCGPPQNVAYSPDGTIVAVAYETSVVIWDSANDKRLPFDCGLCGPDIALGAGHLLAVTDQNGSIRLWNTSTNRQVGRPIAPQQPVESFAFSPESNALVVGDLEGGVTLWNTSTQAEIAALPLFGSELGTEADSVVFRPGTNTLAVAYDNTAQTNGSVVIWNLDSDLESAPRNGGSIRVQSQRGHAGRSELKRRHRAMGPVYAPRVASAVRERERDRGDIWSKRNDLVRTELEWFCDHLEYNQRQCHRNTVRHLHATRIRRQPE